MRNEKYNHIKHYINNVCYRICMDTYIETLLTHLRSNQELSGTCHDMGDVILNLFDEDVKMIFSYKDNDFQGSACAVYEYMDKYIWFFESFGSCCGCDEWAQCDDYSHEDTLNRLVKTVSDNIVDHLYEISFPYESDYMDSNFMAQWVEFASKQGFLEISKSIGERKKKQREEEYALKQSESEKKRLVMESAKLKKAIEDQLSYGKELMNDLEDTIAFLNKEMSSSWFDEKLSAKLRLLVHCINELDNPLYFTESSGLKYDIYQGMRQQAIDKLQLYGFVYSK